MYEKPQLGCVDHRLWMVLNEEHLLFPEARSCFRVSQNVVSLEQAKIPTANNLEGQSSLNVLMAYAFPSLDTVL